MQKNSQQNSRCQSKGSRCSKMPEANAMNTYACSLSFSMAREIKNVFDLFWRHISCSAHFTSRQPAAKPVKKAVIIRPENDKKYERIANGNCLLYEGIIESIKKGHPQNCLWNVPKAEASASRFYTPQIPVWTTAFHRPEEY